MRHIADVAREESHQLALERGSFLHYKGSLFDDPTSNPDYAGDYAHKPMRNATLTAIAPTGTTSAIAGSFCSGIEPAFANAFMREQAGGQMIEFNPYLDRAMRERGFWYDGFHADVHKAHGSVANMTHLPEDMRAVFVTAHDIAPLDHVEMQAVIQENGVDLATSKTINFGESATMEEIADAVVYAHSRGIKGLSIYRDNSRAGQTYSTGDDPRKERIDAVLSHAAGEGFTTTLGRDRETYTITLRDATAGKAKFTCTEEGTHHYITEGGCIRCVNHGISACPTL
jgi:ribonucleoside-diphosphate reductase alpha chain